MDSKDKEGYFAAVKRYEKAEDESALAANKAIKGYPPETYAAIEKLLRNSSEASEAIKVLYKASKSSEAVKKLNEITSKASAVAKQMTVHSSGVTQALEELKKRNDGLAERMKFASMPINMLEERNLFEGLPADSETPNIYRPDIAYIKDYPVEQKGDIRKEEAAYWKRSLELLESIDANIANFVTIVDIVKSSRDKQDEIISIIKEMLEVAKCKDKKKAESAFRKIMNKVHTFESDIGTFMKLTSYATTYYLALKSAGIL